MATIEVQLTLSSPTIEASLTGVKGDPGAQGTAGENALNVDGGSPSDVYGGSTIIDGGTP